MPSEPSAEWIRIWYVVGLLAFVLAGVLAYGWYRHVSGRIEKDRTKLHEHATMLHVHEYKHEETHDRLTKVEEDVKELKDGKPTHGRRI